MEVPKEIHEALEEFWRFMQKHEITPNEMTRFLGAVYMLEDYRKEKEGEVNAN